MSFCPHCGHDLGGGREGNGWKYCPRCGAKISAMGPVNLPTTNTLRTRNLVLACVIVSCLSLLLLPWWYVGGLGHFTFLDTLSMLDALKGYLENTSFDNAGIDIFTKGLWGIGVSFFAMPFVIRTMRFFYKTPNFKGDANALARSLIIYGGGVLYSIIYISGVLTRVKTLFVRNGTSGLEEYGPFLLSISPYVVVTSCAAALLLLYRDRAARIPGKG